MAKRGAATTINHDNWDDPYEAEEAGKFKAAAPEDLQKRVIRTAKRRIGSSTGDGAKSIFSSFGGFKPATSTTDSTNLFGFLGTNASNKTTATPTNGTSGQAPVSSQTQSSSQQQYLSSLQQLNRNVTDWIKSHVDSNPCCILTPVFNDYDKYLKQIQNERDTSEKSAALPAKSNTISSFNFVGSSSSENQFKINVPTTSLDSSNKITTVTDTKVSANPFNSNNPPSLTVDGTFGKSPLLQGSDTSKPSIFSSFKSDSTSSSFFTKPDPASLMVNPFLSGAKKTDDSSEKPLSFSNGSTAASSLNKEKEDEEKEENEEPPKVEFTPVEEEGSVFSTRCKVFVKKDKNYVERGLGTLFIKKVGEDKHQLLVRAETVLGNVLVNTLLSSGMPVQRMGKNNVMLVCLPTPQDLPPPTTILLRVKTSDEADDLQATLLKYSEK